LKRDHTRGRWYITMYWRKKDGRKRGNLPRRLRIIRLNL